MDSINDGMPKRHLFYEALIPHYFERDAQPFFPQYKCKRRKRRYCPLSLMAKISNDTTDDEARLLLKHGVRTFLFDIEFGLSEEINYIRNKLECAMEEFDLIWSQFMKVIFGVALGIIGDNLRVGRLHNNSSVFVEKDDVITLTPDPAYMYTGRKEIIYVFNLLSYSMKLKLNDEVLIGKDIRCVVIKKLMGNVAVVVTEGGLLNFYDDVQFPDRCYVVPLHHVSHMVTRDLAYIKEEDANFIVLTKVRNKNFLSAVRTYMDNNIKCELIGAIDFDYIAKFVVNEFIAIVQLLDYVWISHYFNEPPRIQHYINTLVIPVCKQLEKPIIGTVPLEKCSDFKRFENHDFLSKIDTIFIQKSSWCNKYPLIVKKLVPIGDFRRDHLQNFEPLKETKTSYQAAVNFIIRTISSIECQAIIIHSKSIKAPVALARPEIYCPVFVMLPKAFDLKLYEKDPCHHDIDTISSHLKGCVRKFNLRRSLRCIYYIAEGQRCTPIEYGIYFGRQYGLLETGDFVITLAIGEENEEEIEYGKESDITIMRAFYLPPLKMAEKFKYA